MMLAISVEYTEFRRISQWLLFFQCIVSIYIDYTVDWNSSSCTHFLITRLVEGYFVFQLL